MKLLKRILFVLAAVIVLAVIAGSFYLRHLATRAIPDYNQNVRLKNLEETVTVYRDQYAFPHVYAKNEEDLYRAVGYVMAQDRLWQMDLLRRTTTGRLAEIFGADLIDTDLLMRALRISEKSKSLLSRLDKNIQTALDAFSDGVNQYIDTHQDKLPPEFFILGYKPEKWEPVHCLNLIGYMAWDLTMPWEAEFLLYKLSKKVPPEKFKAMLPDLSLIGPAVFPDYRNSSPSGSSGDLQAGLLSGTTKLAELGLEVFTGSNNWAVSGQKSVHLKPLLANDMHLSLWTPGIWYQIHQVVDNPDNPLDVTGVILPGQPFVVAGHNEHIAWGMTNVMVDDMDFYLETLNPENSNQYRFNNQWRDMETRRETIHTREGKTITKELKFTHRGPVVSQFKHLENEAISMHWIGNEYSNEVRSVYLLNRARNWEEFREAVKTFIAVSQNIIYADTDNNIGLQTAAGIPIRESGGFQIMPGDTDRYDWKGIVPFEELPYSFNPECGYVSSANNKTVNDDYPYYISLWFAVPDRIDRIREMLEAKSKFNVDDFQDMHADVKSTHVERFLPGILEEVRQMQDLDEIEVRALQVLSGWDGVLNKESTAATIFEYLYIAMVKNLVLDELGEALYKEYLGNKTLISNLMITIWKDKNSDWCDDIATPRKETFTWWVQTSFKEAVRKLAAELGKNPDRWQWGNIHGLVLKHPLGQVNILDTLFNLNRGPFPVPGSFHTVCPYSYSLRKPFNAEYGASHRHIYDTAVWDESRTVLPTGISGIPASPYYCDQTHLYTENRYRNDYFGPNWVKATAQFTMIISGEDSIATPAGTEKQKE